MIETTKTDNTIVSIDETTTVDSLFLVVLVITTTEQFVPLKPTAHRFTIVGFGTI